MSANAELMVMQTTDLCLHAGERCLVDRLTWHVEPGQCWCVIGRNGAGKSSLLQTLAGIRSANLGSVRLKNKLLADWPPLNLARERAYLPQTRNDAFGYRVIDFVLSARFAFQADHYWESDDDYQRATAALAMLDITSLANRDIRSLSGGERQRVAIAATVAQETPLLLLDEPTNALDLGHQVRVMAMLSKLRTDHHKSIIMVSHDVNLAQGVSTHALLMMPDGTWHTGAVAQIMKAPLLSSCLGHPIDAIEHSAQTIFVPRVAQ